MSGVKIEVVTRDFDRMLAELAAIDPKVEFRTVVTAVTIRVIQGAANRTRVANVARIRANFADKEWTTLDGKKFKLSWHDPDWIWAAIQNKRNNNLATRLAARGLAKQSWLHLAHVVGGEIATPAYVTSANYKSRQYPTDAATSEEGSSVSYARTIVNSSPIVQAAGGYSALKGAMIGEVGYFRNNMSHQFYLNAARRAAKYPGIFVKEH